MRAVHVNATARTAHVQAGATWGEVDRATQVHGLATPGGEVSVTGVAGLTLGGGLGVMMRTHGLSCDNLRSVEIVTADGMVRTASRDEHADLFWALRGGGRGLGVVTSLEFDLHPLGPDVAAALVLYPYDDAASVLRAWRDAARQAPDTVTPEIGLWSIPPLPDVPDELHGAPVVIVAGVYIGPAAEAGPVLAPLQQLGTPLADMTATMPYVDSQSAVDALFPDGGSLLLEVALRRRDDRRADRHPRRPRRQTADPGVGDHDPHPRRRHRPRRRRRDRLPAPLGALQRQHRRLLARPAARRHRHRLGPIDLGRPRAVRHRRCVPQLRRPGRRHRPSRAALGSNESRLEEIRRAYDPDGLFDAAAAGHERATSWLAAGGMALLAITSVGLWTLRVALTARGRRSIGATVAAVEAVIFAVAFTNVAAHLDSPVRVAGYAAGVAFGTVLGLTADRRLSPGVSEVDIVVPGRDTDTAERLHQLGWPTTTFPARGPQAGHPDLHRGRRHPARRTHRRHTPGRPPRPSGPSNGSARAHASVLPDGYLQIAA